jgi:hypothetical protein
MVRYSCGCQVNWHLGPPPAKCPVHWLQEQIQSAPGGRKLEAALRAARPRGTSEHWRGSAANIDTDASLGSHVHVLGPKDPQ